MMQSAKRVTLVPPEQIGGSTESDDLPESGSYNAPVQLTEKSEKIDRIKNKIYDKIHRFIKIILKLAKFESYDENLRIKSKNGRYLEKSNIVDLLTHAMSVGKVLYGEEDFIALLANAKIDPDLILNENVKSKLIEYQNKSSNTIQKQHREPSVNVIRESSDKPKEVRKGNKKIIIVNDDGEQELVLDSPSIKRKIRSDDDDDTEMKEAENRLKRKRLDEDDDSVDDDMIDSRRWKI